MVSIISYGLYMCIKLGKLLHSTGELTGEKTYSFSISGIERENWGVVNESSNCNSCAKDG